MRTSLILRSNGYLRHSTSLFEFVSHHRPKEPFENLCLLELLKKSNPVLFANLLDRDAEDQSLAISKPTLPRDLLRNESPENFSQHACDYISKMGPSTMELALIAERYHSLIFRTLSLCPDHTRFISTVQQGGIDFLQRHSDYNRSAEGLKASLLLGINLFKISPPTCTKYLDTVKDSVIRSCRNISKDDFLAVLFLFTIHRKGLNRDLYKWMLYQAHYHIDNMSIKEVCFLTSALHKTRTSLNSKVIMDKIVHKTQKNLNNLDPLTYSLLLKGFRFISGLPNYAFFIAMWKYLSNRSQPSAFNCLHLSEISTEKLCYLEELTERLLNAINLNHKYFRPKEVERAIKTALHFEHGKPEYHLVREIIKQVELDDDYLNRYDILIPFARSLCVLDAHLPRIFQKVLSVNWSNHISLRIDDSSDDIGLTNLMLIRDYLMIERYPEYRNHLGELDKLYVIFKRHHQPMVSQHYSDERPKKEADSSYISKFDLIIKEVSRKFPKSHVWVGYLLSSTSRPNLVIYDNPELKQLLNSDNRKPLSLRGCTVFEILTMGQFSNRSGTTLKAVTRLRHRALEKLGAKVITIPFHKIRTNEIDFF